ncbi:hypothetical protein GCM10009634_51760 [Saccharothrix xinjiangensis]
MDEFRFGAVRLPGDIINAVINCCNASCPIGQSDPWRGRADAGQRHAALRPGRHAGVGPLPRGSAHAR